jgi:hypothetical protein
MDGDMNLDEFNEAHQQAHSLTLQRLAENISKHNALTERFLAWQKTLPPPTLRQKMRRKWMALRFWAGCKIAGQDLSDDDDD